MGTKVNSNYEDLLTFTRASKGHALRPVSYGTELVTNGTYDDSSALDDWEEFSGTLSVVSQKLRVTQTTGSNPSAGQTVNTTIGKIYLLTVDYFPDDANAQILVKSTDINGSILYNEQNLTSDGTYRNVFVATKSSIYIQLVAQSSTTGHYAEFDNVSLKEVTFDQPDGTLTLFEHPVNVPRVEWDSAGNRLGLLVEEARTNYNDDSKITSSGWTTVRSSLDRSEGALFLDGTVATRLKEDSSSSNTHHTQDINTLGSSSATFVFSTFVKKPDENSRPYVQLRVSDDPAGANKIYSVLFDLSDGSFLDDGSTGSPSNTFYGSEQYPDGWWRFWCGFTKGGTATRTDTQICLSDTATITASGNIDTYSGDGVSGLYVAGAQVEQGSFPTSYIKNEGTSGGVTRSADVASIPVADFGFNADKFSLVWQGKFLSTVAQTEYLFNINDSSGSPTGTANSVRTFKGTNGQIRHKVTANSVGQVSTDSATVPSTDLSCAVAIKSNSFMASLDGVNITEDTSVTMPTGLTTFHIAPDFFGHIKSIQYYPRRLTNAQLEALTEPRSTPTLSLTFDGLESSYTENYIHG